MTEIEKIKFKLLANRSIQNNGCWLWTGGTVKSGYGKIRFGTGTWMVHRLSLYIFKPDEYSDSLNALHTCDVKLCFNPAHLYAGTQKDNMQDRIEKGNNPELNKTHCIYGHEYTVENTYVNAKGHRSCMFCRKLKDSNRQRKVIIPVKFKNLSAQIEQYLRKNKQ